MTETTEKPNPADFSINARPNEYRVIFEVRGSVTSTVKAESEEAARDKAEAMIQDEELNIELDQLDGISIFHICKEPVLYRVLREGRVMQVSRLQAGDQPREPREDGF